MLNAKPSERVKAIETIILINLGDNINYGIT